MWSKWERRRRRENGKIRMKKGEIIGSRVMEKQIKNLWEIILGFDWRGKKGKCMNRMPIQIVGEGVQSTWGSGNHLHVGPQCVQDWSVDKGMQVTPRSSGGLRNNSHCYSIFWTIKFFCSVFSICFEILGGDECTNIVWQFTFVLSIHCDFCCSLATTYLEVVTFLSTKVLTIANSTISQQLYGLGTP